LCDRIGLRRALVEASALRGVGREYMAACVPAQHSFHPKVWLLVGADEAALLVGSGNLTQSGFTQNAELFEAVRLLRDSPHRQLARDVIHFLAGLRGLWADGERDDLIVLDTLKEIQEAVEALRVGMPAHKTDDLRFLTNFGGPLWDQLREFFEGGDLC